MGDRAALQPTHRHLSNTGGIVQTILPDQTSGLRPKLLDQVRIALRSNHYSPKTEESYVSWIRKFILYNNKTHPMKLGKEDIQRYVSHLAIERNVSSSTQNQALQGILFLYKNVLRKDPGWIEDIQRAKRSKHLPVVFSRNEVSDILNSAKNCNCL